MNTAFRPRHAELCLDQLAYCRLLPRATDHIMSVWKKLLVIAASLAGCAASLPTAESLITSGAPGIEVALALRRLGSAAAIADPVAVERELKLPGIAEGLSWSERLGYRSATWAPGKSALGIVRVNLETKPQDFGSSHKLRTMLELHLESGRCPSEQVLHVALGVAPEFGKVPSVFGGSPTWYTSFTVIRDPGRDVRVIYNDENTCMLRVWLLEPRG